MLYNVDFELDSVNRKEQIATRDIPVFKGLDVATLKSLIRSFQYQVGKATPTVDLEVVNNKIEKGYHSWRAAQPSRYRCVIPKGSKYYYTINGSLQYVSDSLMLVSDKPLTGEECIEICNFPKTYVEACERLGIVPVDESSIPAGTKQHVAYQKLQTVIACINRHYGIEAYDMNNPHQHKWYGSFRLGSDLSFFNFDCYVPHEKPPFPQYEKMMTNRISFLPFFFAVQYVYCLNSEFAGYWKILYEGLNRAIEEDRSIVRI
jgi:hypothetical protein